MPGCSEIYFFSFLVCKYLSEVPHFKLSEVVCLCCICKTRLPTLCWLRTIKKNLSNVHFFLNFDNLSKNIYSRITYWNHWFNTKSATNRHQSWGKITIVVFSTADYIVLRIKIIINIRPWQCQLSTICRLRKRSFVVEKKKKKQ